jgi:hypothetical protein
MAESHTGRQSTAATHEEANAVPASLGELDPTSAGAFNLAEFPNVALIQ